VQHIAFGSKIKEMVDKGFLETYNLAQPLKKCHFNQERRWEGMCWREEPQLPTWAPRLLWHFPGGATDLLGLKSSKVMSLFWSYGITPLIKCRTLSKWDRITNQLTEEENE